MVLNKTRSFTFALVASTAITAMGIGSEVLTISQKLTCATMPIQCSEINRCPFWSHLSL